METKWSTDNKTTILNSEQVRPIYTEKCSLVLKQVDLIFKIYFLARLWSIFSQLKSLSSPIYGTSQYWCHMRNHVCDSCGIRTHDPEVARQTAYPLGHRPSGLKSEGCLNFEWSFIAKLYSIIWSFKRERVPSVKY